MHLKLQDQTESLQSANGQVLWRSFFGDAPPVISSKHKRSKGGSTDTVESDSDHRIEKKTDESKAEDDEWVTSSTDAVSAGDGVDLSSPMLRDVFADFTSVPATRKIVLPSQQAGKSKKRADWGFD